MVLREEGQVQVGTSGWHRPHWRGPFYPTEADPDTWLSRYAERFACVEIDESFHRLPAAETIKQWCAVTPAHFRFAVRAPRSITHTRKLRNCDEAIGRVLRLTDALGEKAGPVLFQLPPRWSVNPRRLDDFLALLPAAGRHAFEFRDPSWHVDEIYAVLEAHGAAFCVYDLAGFTAPLKATAGFVYVRLHGAGRESHGGSYAGPTLRTWSGRIKRWSKREGRDVYVFFDNDESAHAPRNAGRLCALLSEDVMAIRA